MSDFRIMLMEQKDGRLSVALVPGGAMRWDWAKSPQPPAQRRRSSFDQPQSSVIDKYLTPYQHIRS